VAVSKLSRSTDEALPRTADARPEPRAGAVKFSRDGRRRDRPGEAAATGGKDAREEDAEPLACAPTPAGAEMPGGANGAAAVGVVDGPEEPTVPLATAVATAGERGGSGDERAAGVDRGLGATTSPTGATVAGEAEEAAAPVGGADAATVGDDAAAPVARSTVE